MMRPYSAVIFDMDGTLISPLLDFAAIRRSLGIGPDEGILEGIQNLPADKQDEAHEVLLRHELSAAGRAELLPGAGDVVGACRAMGIRTALLTRNTRKAADLVMQRFPELRFDYVRCREDGVIKPEPDGVLIACRRLGPPPQRTLCVGDFEYDIMAASAAGCPSALLVHGREPSWSGKADYVIRSLSELHRILEI